MGCAAHPTIGWGTALYTAPGGRMKRLALVGMTMVACWDGERSELPISTLDFEPESGEVEGWTVTERTLDLACPDGRDARVWFVHPDTPDGPLPTVVLYHNGSFDYVEDPVAGQPLTGTGYQDVSRLELPWAVQMVFATLGMYPDPLADASHTGVLPATLAQAGVAQIVPLNCWGDLWHNKQGTRDNDFYGDQFFRSGGAAAEWPWRMAAEPGFAALVGLDLPFEPDASRIGLIGLGEGGRAVGEVLAYGGQPAAVVIEGHNDDLDAWEQADSDVGVGLDRIFLPGVDRMESAFSSADVLPPTMWIWSPLDPALAAGSQDLALAALAGGTHTIVERADEAHILMNEDAELAAQVVEFLTDRL